MYCLGHITSSFWGTLMSLTACKIYLLFYDHEYERILASQKWAIFIDPSIIKNNWFLNNKNKYGNPIWLIKWLIVPIVTTWILIDITITLTNRSLFFVIMSIWFVPHFIVVIWCWRKFPAFNDILEIRNEIKYTLISGSILSIIVVVQF